MTNTSRAHGGPDAQGVPLYDFSTNSNACGPCPQALLAVQSADTTRYPDPTYAALRSELAAFHAVDKARVLLAGSASEFIFRITGWVARQRTATVRVPEHGYGDYAQAACAWGLRVVTSGPADLHWSADPSSPLGQSPEFESWQAASAVQVIDSAYAPLRLSGASALPTGAMWQLWSPNKALGLTGVRAAYAVAPAGSDDAIAQLENLCPSWPLGTHGAAMLRAWVQPPTQAWLAESLIALNDWKTRQTALLQKLGWHCLPSHANFFCARPYGDDLHADLDTRIDRLRRHGIKLRSAESFGLPGHVRLSVLPPVAQDALKAAWLDIRATP